MRVLSLLSLVSLLAACTPAEAGPEVAAVDAFEVKVEGKAIVGEPAPPFTLPDLEAQAVSLAELQGKTVVLEWFNPGCPFVKYAWDGGPMPPTVQKALANEGVVWLAINSGAPGKQGHGVDTNKKAASEWNIEHKILLDQTGAVGKAYGARTTPHMYVINPEGTLVYNGALDDAPMGRKAQGEPVNYVDKALTDLGGGAPVGTTTTQPYGCSVKYGT